MFNVIYFPTRINERSGSAIDGVFIDGSRVNLFTVASICYGLSDHEAQHIVLEKIFSNEKVLSHYSTWFISKDSLNYFSDTLESETWERIYTVDHINDIFNLFLNILLIHFEASFPIQCVTRKYADNRWITPGIRIYCKREHSLYMLSEVSNNPKIKSCYLLYSKNFM
jgi:hypothetical protein